MFCFDSKKKALKEKLESFSSCNPDVKDIKILVAGQIGAGKSSFINALSSAFQGLISSRVLVSGSIDVDSHSFTQKVGIVTNSCMFFLKDSEMSSRPTLGHCENFV